MSANRSSVAALALFGIMAASATAPPRPILRHPAVAAGAAPLMAFGGRGAAQLASGIGGKLDATLADLAQHASRARPDHALEDLHSLSPAARFARRDPGAEPLVAIDAVTRGDPLLLEGALVSLGLERPAVFRNDVGGWLPVSAIEAAAARSEVTSLRAALSRARAVVATQGDFAQDSATLRLDEPSLTGACVTVGVLSVSYNCYYVYAQPGSGVPATLPNGTGYAQNGFNVDAQMDVASGALPMAGVTVLEEATGSPSTSPLCMGYGAPLQPPFTDEGRAMLQIVHAVAPGAALAFYTADNSEADFANGIQALANAGAKVITDDVLYFDEPYFQDGLLAQAVDSVAARGVAYFSAAGNDSNLAYDNTNASFSIAGSGPQAGEMLLNFDASSSTSAPALMVNVPAMFPGEIIAVILQWDEPFVTGSPGSPGASSQLDLCVSVPSGSRISLVDDNGNPVPSTCTGPNAKGTDPVQILILANPASAAMHTVATTVSVTIGRASGSTSPGRVKLTWEDDGAGSIFANFAPTNNATLQGHPGAAGAAAVGAAFFPNTPLCGVSPAQLEVFSSFGGSPILFDISGTRLQTPVVRQKPDFVGPDGTNTTFFGFTLQSANIQDNSTVAGCLNNASYPNYFGTSAATPHAAGLAALMLQANPAVTTADIYDGIRFTAAPMVTSSPDFTTGYGFIQAGPALAWPNMSVSPANIILGQSATLAWNAASINTCNATAGFSSSAISGSMSVTPTAPGTSTYSMRCANAAGFASETASLVVEAPLSISTTSLPGGQTGVAYSATLAATGGSAPYTWTLISGTLPGGLSLASSGMITGTPTASASNVALTFKVSDSGNPAQSNTAILSLTIVVGPLNVSTTSLASGQVGVAYSAMLAATGGTAPYAWTLTSGMLPSGLSLASSGAITGTPTAAASNTPLTFKVTDSSNPMQSNTVSLSLTIAAASGGGGGGGGGGLDELTLLALAGLGVLRTLRAGAARRAA